MAERTPPRRLRQFMLDMGDVDDQIVPRELRGWRRARAVPVPAITPAASADDDASTPVNPDGKEQGQ